MTSAIKVWWISLGIVALVNIGLWVYSAVLFKQRRSAIDSNIYIWRKMILYLSGAYVFGCAFRSIFPRIDLERLCLVDSWLSSMLVGRSVATVAEICFIAQCAILLREAGKGVEDRVAVLVSIMLIPVIVVAEGFSWYAVISTDYFGSVVEESLWTVAGVLLLASFFSLWPKVEGVHRHFLSTMIVFGVGFVIFMVSVDVPMYWSRWQADLVLGQAYLPFKQGVMDALKGCMVSFDWAHWQEEIPWMTLYFTAAVWVSIYLTHAPNFKIAVHARTK